MILKLEVPNHRRDCNGRSKRLHMYACMYHDKAGEEKSVSSLMVVMGTRAPVLEREKGSPKGAQCPLESKSRCTRGVGHHEFNSAEHKFFLSVFCLCLHTHTRMHHFSKLRFLYF